MAESEVVILGAGFAGLCAAIQLGRAGRSYVVLEKGGGVGGAWRENTYPGVECDIPSHLYSFSFLPNPYWSKSYAPGGEIRNYLHWCAEEEGVLPRIRFGTAAERAEWDGERWHVTTSAGDVEVGRYLISGLGGLHTPNVPDIPGLGSFAGAAFHTARWDHTVDLTGKRVGMVGTGATAVQAGPEVAEIARSLHVFQRTPIWVSPKNDRPYSEEMQHLFAAEPDAMRRHRWDLWNRWESSGVDVVHAGTEANRNAQEAALRNILDHVADPELAARLTPPYNITCKRPTFSNRYYPMFNRPNVHLVSAGIDRVTPHGIVAGGAEIELDAIVMATGFKPFDIRTEVAISGLDGQPLDATWSDRITSYKTIMVHGFPNLFVLLGPNSAGLTSAVQMIESGVAFTMKAIEHVERNRATGLHPRPEAVDSFTRFIDDTTAGTTVNKGCTSWWTESGQNHAVWPESSVTFRLMLNQLRPEDFDLLAPSAAGSVSTAGGAR
jgi:cation diffusion facilitator CzcD-associated flavoprotein CzcO